MPLVLVTGIYPDELELMDEIDLGIQSSMAKDLDVEEEHVDVEFIPNFRRKKKPVVAWLVSKGFKGVPHKKLAPMCDNVVEVLELSGRKYCEAFPIEPKAMRGRNKGEDHAPITEIF